MSVKHPAERGEERKRSLFDRLAELGSNFASSASFFGLCVAIIAAWAVGYATGLDDTLLHVLGDLMAALTLLLVALLKNAELRSEHAIQTKLDAIAKAILEIDQGDSGDARRELRRAIGMHEEL